MTERSLHQPKPAEAHDLDPSRSQRNAGVERAYVWAGFVGMALVFVGLLVAHLFPPPSPGESAPRIAAFYLQHTTGIRIGTIIMGFGAALLGPWYGVVTRRLHTIPGHGPATAYCQLALGAILIFEIVLPITLIQVVAFRPDRIPQDTILLNDLAMILLISPAYTVIVEWVLVGIAILADKTESKVYASWVGCLNLAAAALSVPGVVVIFYKSGPWSLSGLFGFWVPAVAFGLWVIGMSSQEPRSGALSQDPRPGDREPAA